MALPDPSNHQSESTGSITVGNINNATAMAIGHGASVTVINEIVQGIGDLPSRHDGAVQNFLEYYLGGFD